MINSNLPLIVARLVFINQASVSQDHAYDYFNTSLLTELHVNFAVIISCAPFLKHVMHSLQTGWLASDFRTSRPHALSYLAGSNLEGGSRHVEPILRARSGSLWWMEHPNHIQGDTVVTTGCKNMEKSTKQDEALEDGMVIKQTTTVSVQFQE